MQIFKSPASILWSFKKIRLKYRVPLNSNFLFRFSTKSAILTEGVHMENSKLVSEYCLLICYSSASLTFFIHDSLLSSRFFRDPDIKYKRKIRNKYFPIDNLFFVNNIHMKKSNFRICFKYRKIDERKSHFNETGVLVFAA